MTDNIGVIMTTDTESKFMKIKLDSKEADEIFCPYPFRRNSDGNTINIRILQIMIYNHNNAIIEYVDK